MIRLALNPTFEKELPVQVVGMQTPAMVRFTFRAVETKQAISLLMLSGLLNKNWLSRTMESVKFCIRLRKIANGIDLLDQMIVGWDEGDAGFDMPYSKQALLQLIIKDRSVISNIPLAYFAGLQEEKLKN